MTGPEHCSQTQRRECGGPPHVPTGLNATSGDAQVALGWNASTGATSYNVKRSTVNGSGYATVASPTTTSYTNTGLTNGTTYYYVVSAVSSGGESANSSQVSATPVGWTSINDATTGIGQNQFNFVGIGWTHETQSTSYMGDDTYSLVTNDYCTVAFTGTQCRAYIGWKDPASGKVAVSIDGGAETTIDLYSSTQQNQVLIYTSAVLTSGSHTLKMRVTGTKNASSTNTYVDCDRVDVK